MLDNEHIIVMYGASWCPDAARSRRLLDSNKVPYQWRDIDQDPEAKNFVRQANNGKIVVPTIVFPDGSILVEPSDADLAKKALTDSGA